MRTATLLPVLLAAALPVAARGESWPALPPEVWTLKEDPAKGIKGALILEERIHFERFGVTYSYRILVLNEAGRSAAEFTAFPSSMRDFKGRTVFPDGRVLEYNSTKDFQKKTVVSIGETKADTVRMIAPGLTDHCVVDIRWTVPKNFLEERSLGFSNSLRWRLINRHATQKLTVELPALFPLSWNLEQFTGQQAVATEKSGFKYLTWSNLPAEEEIPYSLTPARPSPAITLFQTPEVLDYASRQGSSQFWDAYGIYGVKPLFEDDLTKGSDYKAFLAEVTAGLPATPHAKAIELLSRLDARIANFGALTFPEKSAMGKKALEEEVHARDLKAAVRRRGTTPFGMTVLLFHLLKDAGLAPKVVMVPDRDSRLFSYQLRDFQQFNDVLLSIPEEGKAPLILDPSMRFATPGLIYPDYQGVPALELDPATWKAKTLTMPLQPALFNQRRFTYTLDLQEDEDLFTLQSTFSGYPEYSERQRYLRLEASEQQRHLTERMEEISRSYSVTKAEVVNVANPKEDFGWKVQGRIERPASRRREVLPFPGMSTPIAIPSEFPPVRRENIILPYARIHLAKSTFKLPKGYALPPVAPIDHRNDFGRVVWVAETKGEGADRSVTVAYRVDLELTVASPSAYGQFKEFMGWVREASDRTLILEKQ